MSATATAERYEVRPLRSGQVAVVDHDERGRVALIGTADEASEFIDAYYDYLNRGCECEIDWRCHLHAGQPTHLETRYDYLDEPAWAV